MCPPHNNAIYGIELLYDIDYMRPFSTKHDLVTTTYVPSYLSYMTLFIMQDLFSN